MSKNIITPKPVYTPPTPLRVEVSFDGKGHQTVEVVSFNDVWTPKECTIVIQTAPRSFFWMGIGTICDITVKHPEDRQKDEKFPRCRLESVSNYRQYDQIVETSYFTVLPPEEENEPEQTTVDSAS